MIKIVAIFLLFSPFISYSQTAFEIGFNTGFKNGYCYNDYGCTSPYPPTSPIPSANESWDNYNDGYNRGFQIGLDSKRSSGNNNTSSSYRQVVKPAEWKAPVSRDFLIQEATQRGNDAQRCADNVTTLLDNLSNLILKLSYCDRQAAINLNVPLQEVIKEVNNYSMEDICSNYHNIQSEINSLQEITNRHINKCK